MSNTGLEGFDSTLQKTHIWLDDIAREMGWGDERPRAYLALRSVLHALRDRLTVAEATDLGAQLPMLVRGFYYEGWKPAIVPHKVRHKEEFLAHVKHSFQGDDHMDAEQIVRAVFRVLVRHISEGEMRDVQMTLPAELRALWAPEDVKTWV